MNQFTLRVEEVNDVVSREFTDPPVDNRDAFVFSLAGVSLIAQTSRPSDGPVAMGTTKGVRYQRLVIQNAMILSGRGEPNTNRAMPPEGPVDIVIEGDTITNIVPRDPVNSRNRGARPGSDRGLTPNDARVIDATGMYVIPGLVEMHAHLPGKTSNLGPRGLEYAYRLKDTRLDRTVAVKVLPALLAIDPEFRERFDREARSISALTHPNICTLYDVGGGAVSVAALEASAEYPISTR